MPVRHMWGLRAKTIVIGSAIVVCAVATTAATTATRPVAHRRATAYPHICRSTKHHEPLAIRLSTRIQRVMHEGRFNQTRLAVRVDDPYLGIECYLAAGRHYDSASTVKATILAALLRKAQEQHRSLTPTEKYEAKLMITLSDNSAATYLWNDVGMTWLQHFLNLAGMRHTYLGQNGYWGDTQETAHDEILLLQLLEHYNKVLTGASRRYELRLMSEVVSYERWGAPTGVPASYTVHVKNGWLPIPPNQYWVINSLGAFTSPGRDYNLVLMSDNNPSEGYGIATLNKEADVINRMLNPGTASANPPITPPNLGVPDEVIPASAFGSQ